MTPRSIVFIILFLLYFTFGIERIIRFVKLRFTVGIGFTIFIIVNFGIIYGLGVLSSFLVLI